MSRTISLHHIVINTYRRKMTIDEDDKRLLYKVIFDIIERKGCHTLRINGIANHVHILVDIHPTISCSSLVMEIKRETSRWMKGIKLFPNFEGWGKEYAAFSCSRSDRDRIIEYIKNQEQHHMKCSYEDELRDIYESNGLEMTAYDLKR